ncbi:MAG TPA: PP2C family protein-serine/threonine phosphatase [Terracidiphilus sp.]|nr:PP2C family protein-serine/threonine phosphatase [Terracidiphilus sp.]
MLPRWPGFPRLIAALSLACGVLAAAGQAAPAAPVWFVQNLKIDQLGKGAVPLDGPWQFRQGDDPAWASPAFDDSLWDRLTVDKPWGQQGYDSYEGFAWYRRHIQLNPAQGAPATFSLLIPAIDDVYEVYWNGRRIGGLGHMPPHWVWYRDVQPQIYNLGAQSSGVLAVRVWKSPLFSTDDGRAGGFEEPPLAGSPQAIAHIAGDRDYQWLRQRQFEFALTSLYALVALFSLVAWLRDRDEWVLFWMAAFASCLVLELFLGGLRLHIPEAVLGCITKIDIAVREVSLWFLLLWLLQLQVNRKLLVLTRKAALISLVASAIDGVVVFFYPWLLSSEQMQIVDAAVTPAIIFFELLPIILVAYAFLSRKRQDSARWVVAAMAFANGMAYFVQNVTSQGIRFTHWTFAGSMLKPLFTLGDNPMNVLTILRTVLFFSIVYAVIRSFLEHRRRTSVLEQEYQSARELQRVLVPASQPVIPGFTLTTAYRPAQEVGGDFFQIIPVNDGSTLVVLGDMSGKGLMAAMAVSLIVGALRALAEEHPSPAELLTLLNSRLAGRLQGGFATCIILRLSATSACSVASAGHPAPYLNDRELDLPGALPLGITPEVAYEETTVLLSPGDHFSLYTDGLLEARNTSGELYSFARLEKLFALHPSAAQATQAAINFGQDDDITVLTLTRLAVSEETFTLQPAGIGI